MRRQDASLVGVIQHLILQRAVLPGGEARGRVVRSCRRRDRGAAERPREGAARTGAEAAGVCSPSPPPSSHHRQIHPHCPPPPLLKVATSAELEAQQAACVKIQVTCNNHPAATPLSLLPPMTLERARPLRLTFPQSGPRRWSEGGPAGQRQHNGGGGGRAPRRYRRDTEAGSAGYERSKKRLETKRRLLRISAICSTLRSAPLRATRRTRSRRRPRRRRRRRRRRRDWRRSSTRRRRTTGAGS